MALPHFVIASTVLWSGVVVGLLGALSLVYPLRLLGIRRRSTGLVLCGTGIIVVLGTALFPNGQTSKTVSHLSAGSQLDLLMPQYDFNEQHTALIKAPAERVYQAIKEVRPDEIRLLILLTGLRGLRLRQVIGRDVAPVSSQLPMLEISKRGGFILLAEDSGREIVQGTCAQFWRLWRRAPCPGVDNRVTFLRFREPGYAKAVINFRVVPEGAATRLTTETRILATDDSARRRFAAYWRIIYPGSALIRSGWLEAIRRRAENGGS